jgi:hypothetical protein
MRLAMAAVVVFGLGVAGSCLAQGRPVRPREGEAPCLPENVGTWKEYSAPASGGGQYGLTLAQSRQLQAKLAEVVGSLHRLPVLNPMQGIRAELFQDFCCPFVCQRTRSCARVPAIARIWVLLPYYYANTKTGAAISDPENRAELEITFNNPGAVFNGGSLVKLRDGRQVKFAPTPFRRIGPVMLYRNQDGSDLYAFLTRGSRPLWVPVSQGEYLEAVVAERDSTLAESTQGITDPKMLEGIRKAAGVYVEPLRAQLRSLSASERAAQAWVSNPELGVVPPNSPDARPLVTGNPAYVDRTLPRTNIQIIVVRLEGLDIDQPLPAPAPGRPIDLLSTPLRYCSDVAGARLWELAHQLDWGQLQRLLD